MIEKELLEKLYIEQGLTIREIANIPGMPKRTTITKLLKKYNIVKDKDLINSKRLAKTRETNQERYGGPSPFNSLEVQNKASETFKKNSQYDHPTRDPLIRQKIQQTCLEKYGSITPLGNKEIQKQIREKFNKHIPQRKCNLTKTLNNTHNKSDDEEQVYKLLLEKFSPEDIVRQYESKVYPFPCDFYIKSLDLYIEYQGSWVHGNKPYEKENPIHQKIIEKWQSKDTEYFDYALKIWTKRDPLKRGIAKKNNLNWKEFFSIKELENYLSL